MLLLSILRHSSGPLIASFLINMLDATNVRPLVLAATCSTGLRYIRSEWQRSLAYAPIMIVHPRVPSGMFEPITQAVAHFENAKLCISLDVS